VSVRDEDSLLTLDKKLYKSYVIHIPFCFDCNLRKKTQIVFYLLLGIQFSRVVDFDSLNNSPYYIIKLGLGKWKC